MMRVFLFGLAALAGLVFLSPRAGAEPYFAVRESMQCGACHVNDTGGGMRNAYGNIYAQMQLAATQLAGTDMPAWNGQLGEHIAVGANVRASSVTLDTPDDDTLTRFGLDEARIYLDFSPVPGRVDIYIDQRVAPGASTNQETWLRYRFADGKAYLKAGRMYLPWGWRLEDDTAFIRTVPGIGFDTPDTGAEIGFVTAQWSTQLAVTNGTAGGPELDNGKQASLRVARINPGWRIGAGINTNPADSGDRNMFNVFAGLRTGPVAWLAEIDTVRDDLPGGERTQRVALLEADWLVTKGHTVKLTLEGLDPDTEIGGDRIERVGLSWEYFPFEFTQLRAGVRNYGSDAGDTQERTELILQLHGFF